MITHPRIYHFHPLLAGPMEGSGGKDWHGHLDRIAAMNFDWVLLGPFSQPGASGNLHVIRDPYVLHPLVKGSTSKPADELLRDFASAARAQGLRVMMDLVFHQSAVDAPLVSEHPDWYRTGLPSGGEAPADDMVFADFQAPEAREGLIAYWGRCLAYFMNLGIAGFRCMDASKIPADVWAEVLTGARDKSDDTLFIADSLGCTPEEVQGLSGAGFDLVPNSAGWWDFHSPWLLERYETLRHFSPSIAFPESLGSDRLSAELDVDAPDKLARHYRLRYLFSALFSAGVMMPMGYEFGFNRRLDPMSTPPEDWGSFRFDISTFIAGANALKANCPSLHTEGPQHRLDAPFGAPVSILQLSGETGERGCALVLINPSAEHPAGVDPKVLLGQIHGTYDSFAEVTPDRRPETLHAGEPLIVEPLGLRVFRGDYAAAQNHMAGLDGISPSDKIIRAVIGGDYEDPFAVRGMHAAGPSRTLVVRAYVPGGETVEVIHAETGKMVASLERLHEDGFFAGPVGGRTRPFKYRLRISENGRIYEAEDPYRFGSVLGEMDRYLLGEGTHLHAYEELGAHETRMDGVDGVVFSVWAPNARRVAVVGDFNHWDGRRHPMRLHSGPGIWEIFLPGVRPGNRYKFEIKGAEGQLLPLKADPYALAAELRPDTASVVHRVDGFAWNDEAWFSQQAARNARDAPISIYEMHLGSWRRGENNRFLTYRELSEQLVPYVADMGFTHIEMLPVSEHPFDGSWGYQPVSLFAPTSRFGTPDDFSHLVNACHAAGLGVLLDWVPGHFPTDPHGLAVFDGTALYEHADPRQGFHQDWNTLIYNFGRNEVRNFLINSALFWLDRYHVDGLRVDAVASMLYLDYSRRAGEWIPNRYGGNENLEAIELLKKFNELLYSRFPGAMTVAEESTSWPGVSRPSYLGGLGFGYKWNMGWMHDTLEYMKRDPIHRRYHHNQITFSLSYAFSENFVLPLSHDEVVHGKRSLLGRMPGDDWQKFANLRAYYGFMWTHPGKKLMFMGGEFGQGREWNHDTGLEWHLLKIHWHTGVQRLVRDLNRLYRTAPSLHQRDCEAGGFDWIEANDSDHSILAFQRSGAPGSAPVVVVCNFTALPQPGYRLGVPTAGFYAERLNTDAEVYGGSGMGNLGGVRTEPIYSQNRPQSIVVSVPPMATVIFERRESDH